MYKGKTARRRKINILLVNDTLLVNESPPTTENGALVSKYRRKHT
ncbi:hypothetical protein [Variimorphobacter saccharofermentans]|nr:hypothetical protein [Variimorphobacter saccharofermentans]